MRLFQDRYDAGRTLGAELKEYADRPDVVVLGLPRGGMPVAAEVARMLDAPLDVFVVRKLGVPGEEELAMGAVATGGVVVVNQDVVSAYRIPSYVIEAAAEAETGDILRRERLYRGKASGVDITGRTVILVDDGLATGATMAAAVMAVRALGPARVVIAVPVAPGSALEELKRTADDVVVVDAPESFFAVGQWYVDFQPTTDDEVRELLSGRREADSRTLVSIPTDGVVLRGDLVVPPGAAGLVVFAHGSGSSRHSPRNRLVARALHDAGLATLLFDLLSEEEEQRDRLTGELRFDIEFLAGRLLAATDWMKTQPGIEGLSIGYFGSSTGAAAALVAAARRPADLAAIVARGGRPDLADDVLSDVRAPTLLLVGSQDPLVLGLNRQALGRLRGERRLEVVQGATHLFEESGALERVAALASAWFASHLAPPKPRESRSEPGLLHPR
jgi:predicted phosphoribosyltransferase/dienelactone hydrolase